MPSIAKAYAMEDVKISFVSLVDKAANKREFLITKADDGQASFRSLGRIINSDAEKHYVTGVVYEPMVEDTHGNFMTEEEIEKAAHWFMKNQGDVDLQHSFEPLEGAHVVETHVAKSDEMYGDETVTKGTWVMTMEIENQDVFEAIQKGEITGLSMGGVGVYSEEDVELPEPDITKSAEGKSFLKKLASMFGMDAVEKGAVRDQYEKTRKRDAFWNAYYALTDFLLSSYNPFTGRWEQQTDENVIRDAINDFSEIALEIMNVDEPVTEALEADTVQKAGRAISTSNLETLRSIHESLGGFLSKFDESEEDEEDEEDPDGKKKEQEEEDVTKEEVQAIVDEAITKAMGKTENGAQSGAGAPVEGNNTEVQKNAAQDGGDLMEGVTAGSIQKMVEAAVTKAFTPEEQKLETLEDVQKAIDASVEAAFEKVLKSAGLPTNLNAEESSVQKNEGGQQHYLHGIL